ncbi:hypothetical protein [Bradyrhizobium sp. Ghvi]|uniref:hypothetical protein n=1 Tax=Bradyrhizobium sp. Ghvi TaxID=1855319 RepID=UPI001FCCFB12|nr:hypothetical protein [Bradyrhizobium sp. Ghvi]
MTRVNQEINIGRRELQLLRERCRSGQLACRAFQHGARTASPDVGTRSLIVGGCGAELDYRNYLHASRDESSEHAAEGLRAAADIEVERSVQEASSA